MKKDVEVAGGKVDVVTYGEIMRHMANRGMVREGLDILLECERAWGEIPKEVWVKKLRR